jgi:hypothetical protein
MYIGAVEHEENTDNYGGTVKHTWDRTIKIVEVVSGSATELHVGANSPLDEYTTLAITTMSAQLCRSIDQPQ